jgi:hypothetical protein
MKRCSAADDPDYVKNATCHTPLESLNFSGSFGVKIFFLNQIFVNKTF